MQAASERQNRTLLQSHAKTQHKLESLHSGMDSQFSRLHVRDAREELLISLFYPEHAARRESIKPPHEQTFDWIFDGERPPGVDESEPSWSNFTTWLACSDSLYWVTGKVGSGKSTLMAHIVSEGRTTTSLQKWAAGKPLHVLSFFFWRPGSQLQRSIPGLLRSLAYQLFEEVPDLAEQALRKEPLPSGRIAAWTEARLFRLLQLALGLAQDRSFCFFLDGLDEFDGDPDNLLDIIFDLQNFPNVKFCNSSRPETEIRQRLSSYSQLKMEHLNRKDIETFVQSQLERYGLNKRIMREIRFRADGVFLWAVLATQSVIRGIKSNDNETTLLDRLQQLPAGLNAMFRHMLSAVEPVHRRSLGLIFRVMDVYRAKDKIWGLGPPLPSILHMTILLNEGVFDSCRDLWNKCAQVKDQILAQSQGLLVVEETPDLPEEYRRDHGQCLTWAIPESRLSTATFHDLGLAIRMRELGDHGDLTNEFYRWHHRSAVYYVHRSAFDFVFEIEPELAQSLVIMPSKAIVLARVIQAWTMCLIMPPIHTLQNDYYRSDHITGNWGILIAFIDQTSDMSPSEHYLRLDAMGELFVHFNVEELMSEEYLMHFYGLTQDPANMLRRLFVPMQIFWTICMKRELYDYVQARLPQIATDVRDCPNLIAIVDYALVQDSQPGVDIAVDALSQMLRIMEHRLSTPHVSQVEPLRIETRVKNTLRLIRWSPVRSSKQPEAWQEDIMLVLCRSYLSHVIFNAFWGDHRGTIRGKEGRTNFSHVVDAFLNLLSLWDVRIEQTWYLEAATNNGRIRMEFMLRPYTLGEWKDLEMAGSASSVPPCETSVEIWFERHIPKLRRPESTDRAGPSQIGTCLPKIRFNWTRPRVWKPPDVYLGAREDCSPYSNIKRANDILYQLWKNEYGCLNAWQQLCAVAYVRMFKRRAERRHEVIRNGSGTWEREEPYSTWSM